MAAATIENLNLLRNTWADMPAGVAVNATDGLLITPSGGDQKMLILCENGGSGAVTVAVKGGEGPMALGDLTLSFAAGAKKVIAIESGRYMQADGTILLTGPADVKVSAIFLP